MAFFKAIRLSSVGAILLMVFTPAARSADRSTPLLIAPHIQGEAFCPAADADPKIVTQDDAAALCAKLHANAAAKITQILDAIGPELSPSRTYALGYMLTLPLMRYAIWRNGSWSVDTEALENDVSLVRDVDRPVVIYLSANHFADAGLEASQRLASDPRNLMWTANGPLKADHYFGSNVNAWTLADRSAPITLLRRQLISAASQAICGLDAHARQRVAAISLLGEVHQLFPDVLNGAGFNSGFAVTDYSPASVAGFRDWLSSQFTTIATLNMQLGSRYPDFSSIQPPTKNALKGGGAALEHIDASAAGKMAIYGWAYDPTSPQPVQVSLYVDRQKVAAAPADLNRTDVTDALADVTTPNVGWRFDYDFRALSAGQHALELVATGNSGKPVRFGGRRFIVAAPSGQAEISADLVIPAGSRSMAGMRLAIDGPAPDEQVLYNPLARLWLAYRNVQVRSYYEQFSNLVEASCIPRAKVFSHEITPEPNASWNGDLMAVDAAQDRSDVYQPGSTLYGGAAFGNAFFRLQASKGWKIYSVPEMHPTFSLSEGDMKAMLERHRNAGAAFVSPYYLYAMPQRIPRVESKLDAWRITKDNPNPRYGAATFYAAISDLMRNN